MVAKRSEKRDMPNVRGMYIADVSYFIQIGYERAVKDSM